MMIINGSFGEDNRLDIMGFNAFACCIDNTNNV